MLQEECKFARVTIKLEKHFIVSQFVLNKDKTNIRYRKTVGVSGAFVFLLDT